MPDATVNLYDLPRPALDARLAGWGFSPQYRERVWTGLYRDGVTATGDLTGLRPDLQAVLQERAHLGVLATHHESFSSDGLTHKLLLRLHDAQTIETVLMRFKGRATVCVSTQAGCAMGCVFCATGQMGLSRHLTPGEIVGQVLHVTRVLRAQGEALRNIVLMGMGEPLHNYEHTMAAVDILVDPKGLALAPRFITLSTVGVVPGILRLADEARPVQLAVSLHGATDAERAALVPAGRRWPLNELMDACRYYVAKRKRRIFFEWTLIAGRNDTAEHAHHLGQLLHGMDAHVNVIPLNPTVGYDGGPSVPDAVRAFQDVLTTYGVPSTVRQRRGIDIDAGCGQLKAAVERKPRRSLPVAS
ncbi:23S rRNA (adenine(2503)-C(2))-methyltransferase RlmN [Corallococcus carmarthensis]|uniref:Probable dual-specificity RNA methyltransferase RlmN n=1 Tax=Corallococcus carmarthensis TaxID=2316728 RepID=A0A3A8K670_9BACT|nr:23S rRNA (adenine(2503)-C(2))-methyltransferase RlmN [Corallococcus carmarthensis]RKG99650.1 23S rRNA (adenine(2503)-C(2))-methyltransferase RlmN [Corallococcus carmarthensis]